MTITTLRPTPATARQADAVDRTPANALHNVRCVRTPHVVSLYGQPGAWVPAGSGVRYAQAHPGAVLERAAA